MSKKRRRNSPKKRNNTGSPVNANKVTPAANVKHVDFPAEVKWESKRDGCCAGSDVPAVAIESKAGSWKDFFTVERLKAAWIKLLKGRNSKFILILCACIMLQCICMVIWAKASNAKSKAILDALSTEAVTVTEADIEPVMEVFLPVTTVNKYEIIDDGLVHNVSVDGTVRSLFQSIVGDNVASWYKKADYIGFADLDNTGVPELIIWDDNWHYTVYKINLETAKLTKWQEFDTEGSLTFGYYRDADSALNVWVGTITGEQVTHEVFLFNDSDLVREGVSKSDFRDTYTLIGADNLFVRSKHLDDNSNYTAVVQTLLDLYYD